MDGYIAKLEKFLGKEHPSTQGFTIIRDLLEKGDAPPMGVFYAGRKYVNHDLVFYSIGEKRAEFEPINFEPDKGERRSLLKCLEKATEIAGAIQNPPMHTDHLVVLAMDQAAVEELQKAQAEMNGNGATINGCRITYVSVPLLEHKMHYEETPAVEEAYSAPEEKLSTQSEAIRQSMLTRYCAEKSAVERFCGDTGMPEIKPTVINKQAP